MLGPEPVAGGAEPRRQYDGDLHVPIARGAGRTIDLELSVLISLMLTLFVYGWGTRQVWQRAGAGRGITPGRLASFVGAMTAFVVALASPLDDWSQQLFSAHMAQHLILIMIAAPLLVLSDLPLAFFSALPPKLARAISRGLHRDARLTRAWRTLTGPISAWLAYAAALWLWHAPLFYVAALEHPSIHFLEHLTFVATSMLFWWVLLRPTRALHLRYAVAVPYLFTTALQSGALGALMTFTTEVWYSYYAPSVAAWGLTPLQDQQIAGLLMWIPGGLVFTALTIAYFAAWLAALERRDRAMASTNERMPSAND